MKFVRQYLATWTAILTVTSLGIASPIEAEAGLVTTTHLSTPIEKISVDERQKLPDDALVTIGTRQITMRSARAADAALKTSFTSTHKAEPTLLSGIITNGADSILPSGKTTLQSTLFKSGAGAGISKSFGPIPTASDRPQFPIPTDFTAACGSATVCLFFPANVPWYSSVVDRQGTAFVQTYDIMITPQACAADGGVYSPNLYCIFNYPTTALFQFTPPTGGFSIAQSCPSTSFQAQIDKKGAIVVFGPYANDKPPAYTGNDESASADLLCAITINAAKK